VSKILLVSCIAILSCLQISIYAQQEDSTKVLFVGNSYTYFWNLPQTVEAMSFDGKHKIDARQSTNGGVNLGQHWRSEKNLDTRSLIAENDYDVIVLQDHSKRAIEHPDSLHIYGTKFSELIHSRNAEVFLYMTWSRKWDPFMLKKISEQYEQLAKETGATLVPVGIAWDLSRKMRPELDLYDIDQSHPSPEGTYLIACMFYGALTGQSPIGLPERIISTDQKGEKLYLNIQSKENASFLQNVADSVLNSYKIILTR